VEEKGRKPSVAGLLGTHRYQLDPKGRISLPKGFRGAFADGAYLTLGHDGCVFAFPSAEWEHRSGEIQSRPLNDPEGRAYARMFFGNAEAVELDAQGRMVLPQRLRTRAGIKRETVVVGVQDRMEIWDGQAWESYEAVHDSAYQAGALGDR
jgi:MraZ protein